MRYAIGIDLGGTNTKIALVNDGGQIVKKDSFSTKGFVGPDPLIKKMVAVAEKMVVDAKVSKEDFCGIGIGVPGIVDSVNGIIYNLTNIPGWRNVHLQDKFQESISTNIFIDNDVNLMALGELYYGAAKGAKNIVCVTLGTGVGGGIIIEGKLYRGSSLSAGEIGHITINENGPKCACGNRGCLEVYVGNEHIVEAAVSGLNSGRESLIKKIVGSDLSKITPQVISEAAEKGDAFAIEIWRRVGECIGIVFADIANSFNPEMFVVGGGVAKAGHVMYDAIRNTLNERAFKVAAEKAKVEMAALGNDAGVIGAATLAMIQ